MKNSKLKMKNSSRVSARPRQCSLMTTFRSEKIFTADFADGREVGVFGLLGLIRVIRAIRGSIPLVAAWPLCASALNSVPAPRTAPSISSAFICG
jgi:hypothetical protein